MHMMIVVMDANEATIGKTNGERIEIIWSEQSMVPRKHNKGGQSKNRFQRGRQEALKGWIKMVTEKIICIHDMENLIIGGPGMTKDILIKRMPP